MLTILFDQWFLAPKTTLGGDNGRSAHPFGASPEEIHRDDNEILEILAIAARFLN